MHLSPSALAVLQNDVQHIKVAVEELKGTLQAVGVSLNKLVAIESRQLAHDEKLDAMRESIREIDDRQRVTERALPVDLQQRLQTLESEMPSMKHTRYWVYAAITALVGACFWGFVTGHLVVVAAK